MMHTIFIVMLAMSTAIAYSGTDKKYNIDPKKSGFLVFTRANGPLKKFAVAPVFRFYSKQQTMHLNPHKLSSSRIKMSFPIHKVQLHDHPLNAKLFRQLSHRGMLLEQPIHLLGRHRRNIREFIWARKQLNRKAFPEFSTELINLNIHPIRHKRDMTYYSGTAKVALTIRGIKKQEIFRALLRLNKHSQQTNIELFGKIDLDDFQIKTLTIFFGALSIDPQVHIYANLRLNSLNN